MEVSFLMDVAPNPPPVVSDTTITVLVAMVLGLALTLIAGFVYLLIRIKRRRRLLQESTASAPAVRVDSAE